jgi:2-phospho-L-lactate guanylyltransferase
MTDIWRVLIPVKPLRRAKSRLNLPSHQRVALALAMCRDVIAAVSDAAAVADVYVISRDTRVHAAAVATGAKALSVPGARGLNDEVATAHDLLGTSHRVVAVMGDLPCLTSTSFSRVLSRTPGDDASYVPDLAGEGTTMLMSAPSTPIAPLFGPRSANAHAAIGHRLDGESVRARCDVDTVGDLRSAWSIGLGAHTLAVLGEKTDFSVGGKLGLKRPSAVLSGASRTRSVW